MKEGKVYVPKDKDVVRVVEEMKKVRVKELRGEE